MAKGYWKYVTENDQWVAFLFSNHINTSSCGVSILRKYDPDDIARINHYELNGLKMKVVRPNKGDFISFVCPNKEVETILAMTIKNTFNQVESIEDVVSIVNRLCEKKKWKTYYNNGKHIIMTKRI